MHPPSPGWGKGGVAYINDATQGSNRVRSINRIATTAGVLHDGAGDHDNVLSRVGQLLDNKVDHLAKAGILVLEELGDAEEKGGGLVGGEVLSGVEEQGNLGQEDAALARLDGRVVEQSCCRAG